MQIVHQPIPPNANIFLFGDSHEGLSTRHDDGWRQLVDMINHRYDGLPAKCNFGIDHGDSIEARTIDHPYYHPDNNKFTKGIVFAQWERALEDRKPIAKRLVTILDGNHDYSVWKFVEVASELSKKLTKHLKGKGEVIYGTYDCRVHWFDDHGPILKSYHTHGQKALNSAADDPKRRKANMELVLKRHLKFKFDDCALMCKGHTHKLLVCDPVSELGLYAEGDTIKQRYTLNPLIDISGEVPIHMDHRWYVNTGSFLKMHAELGQASSYTARGEYDPIELGFGIAKIRDRKLVEVEKVLFD